MKLMGYIFILLTLPLILRLIVAIGALIYSELF
jgi:hypothetical protein